MGQRESNDLTKEERLKDKMYRLGYEDASNKREFGSSLDGRDYDKHLEEQSAEQITLF